jgi:hypothetical protein
MQAVCRKVAKTKKKSKLNLEKLIIMPHAKTSFDAFHLLRTMSLSNGKARKEDQKIKRGKPKTSPPFLASFVPRRVSLARDPELVEGRLACPSKLTYRR